MSNIIKRYEIDIEGETIYDGKKSLLANLLKISSEDGFNDLQKAIEDIPVAVQGYIISYLENFRKKTEKEFAEKVDIEFQSARKTGYAEGFSEGRIEALKSLEEAIKNLLKAAESIENFKNELYKDVKDDVINLSLEIARSIVKAETGNEKDAVAGIIGDIINSSAQSVNFTVRLNPTDYSAIAEHPETVEKFTSRKISGLGFLPDPNLLPGDVVIKTDFGEVDARIGTQLERVKKIFGRVKTQ